LEEVQKSRGGRRPGTGSDRRKGEVITGAAKGERIADSLKAGDRAPDFTLSDPSGKREVTLSNFQGKKPVVLIFGSYT
jgi:peroxiredoxin